MAAEKKTPKAEEKQDTAAETATEHEAATAAARAEKQRLLALRLQFGPIRDPE